MGSKTTADNPVVRLSVQWELWFETKLGQGWGVSAITGKDLSMSPVHSTFVGYLYWPWKSGSKSGRAAGHAGHA